MKNQSAYLQTVFQYIPSGKPKDFWVITAYNPFGKEAPPTNNLQADLQLKEYLAARKIDAFRVTGVSPDEAHAEPGWGIVCAKTTAYRIGRKFGQLAIFHFHGDQIDLVDLNTYGREALPDPASRIRDPRGLLQFTLWVGSPDGGRIDPLKYTGICTRAGALFDSFTAQRAEGCFQSHFEDALLIHVATREPRKVIELGHSLRCFLNQDGIGISHNGIYQRLRDWSDDEFILEAFTHH